MDEQTILVVPGLYCPGLVMAPLVRRFKQQGYRTVVFSHRYYYKTPEENARQLYQILQAISTPVVHMVGHSLGGLVILHCLKQHPDLALGRVVLLATPSQGSELARRIHAKHWLRVSLGKSVVDGLLSGVDAGAKADIGVIYGSARQGIAALIHKPSETNDGVVSESETRISGMRDSVCIPHSHALMLFSKVAADKTVHFLQTGQFLTDQQNT